MPFSVVVPGLIAYKGVGTKPPNFSPLFLKVYAYVLRETLKEHYDKLRAPPVPGPPPVAVPTAMPTLLPPVVPVPPITVKVGAPALTPVELIIPVFLYSVRQLQLPELHYTDRERLRQDIAVVMNTTVEV